MIKSTEKHIAYSLVKSVYVLVYSRMGLGKLHYKCNCTKIKVLYTAPQKNKKKSPFLKKKKKKDTY